MVSYYKFIKDCNIFDEMQVRKGDEFRIYIKGDIGYVVDGCFPLFKINTKVADEYGEIVYRLW